MRAHLNPWKAFVQSRHWTVAPFVWQRKHGNCSRCTKFWSALPMFTHFFLSRQNFEYMFNSMQSWWK